MTPGLIPLLWLCGPSGVGKSSVGWEIYSRLTRSGVSAGLVELDQIGMCFPAPDDDPSNDRLRAGNLGRLWSSFRSRGVRGLVVTGNVDSADALRRFLDQLPGAEVTMCRIRAEREELRGRYVERGLFPGLLDRVLEDADAMDAAHFAEFSVDTSGTNVVDAAGVVLERTGWSPSAEPMPAVDVPFADDASNLGATTPLLWLCGPRCVGKKATGFTIVAKLWRAGINAAFVDLEQVSYYGPFDGSGPGDPRDHRLTATNLGAVWRGFRAAGAVCVVISGDLDDPDLVSVYAAEVPGARLITCRLVAGLEQLTERVLGSASSQGPGIPNPLKGMSEAELRSVARRAFEAEQRREPARVADLRVDTTELSVPEVASAVTAQIGGWPQP
jgi:hypothetical protein